jgi:hypothetical protein
MKHTGTITRIQRSRGGVTLIIDKDYGPRGIELDRDLWSDILEDFDVSRDAELVGWDIEYNPSHGDLTLIAPDDPDPEDSEDDSPERT